ncbi:manganese efflux pump MntP family protein [Clostridium aminobutyricum]|uniref:Putative manganese efflux pump MntP n=1 Tax=Clostridium aminobutyricum TaxID=33953 RepID=A0A939IJN8_CLOAM|nr:manganese efflux pump MntP family protein [Clostridium aminobutyricum]MBN7773788.1 manganese efflux pump [Clostridium aminobutyricum]
MTLIEIIFIGIGLAMDAVAVSMTNGMVCKNLQTKDYVQMTLFFALFQALMPLIGYFAGGLFADIISRYAGIVILLILGVIGGKMIKEGWEHMAEQKAAGGKTVCDAAQSQRKLTFRVLIFQSIATSIDAFAVGVGFSAMRVDILQAVAIIAFITADLVALAIVMGRKFGDILGCRAEILGGLILVIIGLKAVI